MITNTLKKVFNWSEVHLSEVTSYKIHTLVRKLKLYIAEIQSMKIKIRFQNFFRHIAQWKNIMTAKHPTKH